MRPQEEGKDSFDCRNEDELQPKEGRMEMEERRRTRDLGRTRSTFREEGRRKDLCLFWFILEGKKGRKKKGRKK